MPQTLSNSPLARINNAVQGVLRLKPLNPKVTVGIDIGTSAVKVVALGAHKGTGSRPVIGQNLIEFEGGPQADPAAAIREAVNALKLPVRTVNLSVSGQWVIMRIVELPKMKPDEMKHALPFEAQRYLPFNVQEVMLDGVVLGPSDANKVWVLIVACKKELIERRVELAKRAHIDVGIIDVDALALTNSFLESREGDKTEGTRAVVDLGAELTNLVVCRGNVPYLVRDIPWGGMKLVRAMAQQLGTEEATVRTQVVEGSPSPEIRGAMQVASESLMTELQLSFDYFENRFGSPPEELFVSGGLSHSGALIDSLKGHLAQTVTPWTPAPGLTGQYAVAYGLAMRVN